MAKRKPAEKIEVGSLERYDVVKVHRSQLKSAPYNPRILTDAARAKLKAGILRHGLVGPQTWNARSGNLVGGHQRTAILDDAYGTDDYEVTVARIDVDDVRERELNLLLNNAHAQGDWDGAKLEAMFKDAPTMELGGTGFDGADLFRLFGASPFEGRADDALSEVARKVREAREKQAQIKGKVKEREGTHFYLVVVFKDEAERTAFTDAVGWEDNRYQSGDELRHIAAHWIAEHAATESDDGEDGGEDQNDGEDAEDQDEDQDDSAG